MVSTAQDLLRFGSFAELNGYLNVEALMCARTFCFACMYSRAVMHARVETTQVVTLIERLGAFVIDSGAFTRLARALFNKALDRDTLKARVGADNAIALERLRFDLAIMVHEHQQRSASLIAR